MRRFGLRLFALTLVALAAGSSLGANGFDPPPGRTSYVLECGRVFDGVSLRTRERIQILIENGRIAAIGPDLHVPDGAEHIVLDGATLAPGLIDAHTHLSFAWNDTTKPPDLTGAYLTGPVGMAFDAARNAKRTLESGFTTVRDLGCTDYIDVALAQAIAGGSVDGPRVVTSGPIQPPGGGRTDIRWPPDGSAGSAPQILEAARAHLAHGCDWLKIYETSGTWDDTSGVPYFTTDEIRAAVDAAHPRGRWVAAHAMGVEGARRAVEAGVRSIEHGSRLDDAVARAMARKHVYLVPTLYHLEWYSRHGAALGYASGYADRLAALQKEQFASVKRARRAGVAIGCGSDAIYSMHGENAMELVWLVKAGLTPIEALRSATSVNAGLLGLDRELGRIAPGYAADLVAFSGDPASDIETVMRPIFVMKGGRIIRRP